MDITQWLGSLIGGLPVWMVCIIVVVFFIVAGLLILMFGGWWPFSPKKSVNEYSKGDKKK